MKRTHNEIISLVAIALWVAGTSPMAGAQPIRETAAGRVVTVPERVLVYLEDGRMEVVTRDVPLEVGASAAELVPLTVPVFEVNVDGTISAGVYARNTSGHAVTTIEFLVPEWIRWDRETEYVIYARRMGATSTHGLMEDGYMQKRRDSLEVYLTPELDQLRRAPIGNKLETSQFQISITPDEASFMAAFPLEPDLVHMRESVERVEIRIQELLEESVGIINMEVLFAPLPGFAGFTVTWWNPHSLSAVKLALLAKWAGYPSSVEANFEKVLYNNIPGGSVPFSVVHPMVENANKLAVATALQKHLTLGTPQATDATITINTNLAWDFDSTDGPLAPTDDEFEGVLMHEVIHGLGFFSLAGDNPLPTDKIVVWDMFRFDESIGLSIHATEFLGATRPLNKNVPTIYTTKLSSEPYSYLAANGLNHPVPHWRSFSIPPPPEPIGIMDPIASNARRAMVMRFYTKADLRALDIMGWALNPNDFVTDPPAPLVPDDPPQGSYLTSDTPTFTWGPDPQNDKWHVTIFEGLTTDPSAIVLAPRDLTTETYAVPASTPLADATTYTWVVVGEIIAGFTYSESSTFTVCYADCDQSTGPGVLDVFDFLCFQNAFVTLDPYACDCDTSTGLGVCDVFDFLCFQNAYVAGCP